MKSYPSISYYNDRLLGQDVIAFDKLDGNNIRFEWSIKSGWYKFGSRTQLIDRNTPILGQSIDIFLNKYSDNLQRIFRTEYPKDINFIVFCELWGANSFSGKHQDGEELDLTLIDVSQYKRGFIPTLEYIDNI